jgi:hypothetical protein
MTLTVDIRPEVEAELARRASLRGSPVEAYAATLLEEAVHLPSDAAPVAKNMVELFAPVRGLLTDEEIDHLFSRNPSTSRPVDLS